MTDGRGLQSDGERMIDVTRYDGHAGRICCG